MTILQNFCFCAKLETGGYIIGIVGYIYGIYFIMSSVNGTVKIIDKSDLYLCKL